MIFVFPLMPFASRPSGPLLTSLHFHSFQSAFSFPSSPSRPLLAIRGGSCLMREKRSEIEEEVDEEEEEEEEDEE